MQRSRRSNRPPLTWATYPFLTVAIIATTAFRIVYAFSRQLVPDEAYYWVWSRNLASGYLDHPPMVAWVIWLGTFLFGSNELGVRIGAIALAMGTIFIMMRCARQAGLGPRAERMVGWILLASPLIQILGGIITPDTPATFFAAVALWAAIAAGNHSPGESLAGRWWLVMGLAVGLALCSKYTSILAAAAIFFAVCSSAQGRAHLRTIWPWLSIVVAAAVFMPVVHWNATHQWASFRFQWNHGTSDDDVSPLKNFLLYILGQFAVWTPVLAIVCGIALVHFWKRVTHLDLTHRILLLSATLPLVFFGWSSLHHKVEANWPVLAILPAAVLVCDLVGEETRTAIAAWLRIGVIVSACATAVLHFPEISRFLPERNMPSKWADLFGWREMAHAVDVQANGEIEGMTSAPSSTPVFSENYQLAAEMSFYMSGQPVVWTWTSDRPTAYDYFNDPLPDPTAFSHIVFLRKISASKPPPPLPAKLTQSFNITSLDDYYPPVTFGKALKPVQIVAAERNTNVR